MKKKRKSPFLWFLYLSLTVVLLLAGCARGAGNNLPDTDAESDGKTSEDPANTGEPEDEPIFFVKDGVTEYKLVYDSTSEVAELAARSLAWRFSSRYKVTMEVQPSSEAVYSAEAKEIYIGNTGFAESVQAEELLNSPVDFCVTQIGQKIVFLAGSDLIYGEKIEDYIEKVLQTNASFDLTTGKATIVFDEYFDCPYVAHSKILVGDADLKNFTIVYAEDSSGYLKRKAQELRDSIRLSYGVILPTVSDTAQTPGTHEILIGNTNRPESAEFTLANAPAPVEYIMGVQGGKYILSGGGIYATGLGIQRFTNLYLLTIPKVVNIPADRVVSGAYLNQPVAHAEGSELRLMTLNVMAEYHAVNAYGEDGFVPNSVRMELIQAVLDMYMPDVIGLQEASPLWRTVLAESLDPDIWGIVDPGKQREDDNGETVIVYNRQVVTLEESGPLYYPSNAQTSRLCYGVFHLNSNSAKRFLFYTTHWSWSSAEIADMEMRHYAELVVRMRAEHGNIAAFCTADYNTGRESERMLAFGENSGLTDTYWIAQTAGTLIKEVSAGNVDHIYAPPGTEVLRYEMLDGTVMSDMTDHYAKYADVSW